MYAKLFIASTLAALAVGLPHSGPDTNEAVTSVAVAEQPNEDAASTAYKTFKGDGSTKAGWPSMGDWKSFDALWAANKPLMAQSCSNNQWGADDSSAEIADIKAAIAQQASATKLDKRVILATIMQESIGCVRVPTTNNGVSNPGLMQSHNGKGTCAGKTPCPKSEINQMVEDGTKGTSDGDGIEGTLKKAEQHLKGGANAQAYYASLRLYNSGSIDWSNLDNGEGSTACYVSDIANRLVGWSSGTSGCTA